MQFESFDNIYSIFNLPYLFESPEQYHAVMDNSDIIEPIFTSTAKSGFEAVTWLDAGTRSFYTVDKPIETPDDLKGLKSVCNSLRPMSDDAIAWWFSGPNGIR